MFMLNIFQYMCALTFDKKNGQKKDFIIESWKSDSKVFF